MNAVQRNKNNTQIIFLKLNLLFNNENKLGLVKKRLSFQRLLLFSKAIKHLAYVKETITFYIS